MGILKTIFAVSMVFWAILIYRYVIKIWLKIGFYKGQGVKVVDGAYIPLIGNLFSMAPLVAKALEGGDRSNPQVQLVRNAAATDGIFDSSKNKALMMVYGSIPLLVITDPEMVQEIYVTKNKLVDKNGTAAVMFEEFIGQSFVFARGDKKWETIRKACAHAFYKERLAKMTIVIKEKVQNWIDKRHAEIEASSDNKAVVDIAKSFERLFCRNIVHICFGEDISATELEIEVADGADASNMKFQTKRVCFPEAVRIVADQCCQTALTKIFIEPVEIIRKITGIKHLTGLEATLAKNCQKVRGIVTDYVRKRKSGEKKSQVADGVDLLSLFESNPDVFTEDLIVDEILDFFTAGTITTQFATQTLLLNLAKNPQALKKIREEFMTLASKHPAAEDSTKTKKEAMAEIMDIETAQDLEYLNFCMQETLRIRSPGIGTSQLELSQDSKIGNITIKKGDAFIIDFYSLHFDKAQWQRPNEFIPERFDTSNQLSLTPDGKKRHPNAFTPWAGGKRVCFGKTFAEMSMKIVATYITQAFNMKIVDKKHESELPVGHFGMIGYNKIDVEFTKNE